MTAAGCSAGACVTSAGIRVKALVIHGATHAPHSPKLRRFFTVNPTGGMSIDYAAQVGILLSSHVIGPRSILQ
jgi:hypothetical protein